MEKPIHEDKWIILDKINKLLRTKVTHKVELNCQVHFYSNKTRVKYFFADRSNPDIWSFGKHSRA